MGNDTYTYAYDPIGHQKSAKPKAKPPGDRDFEAVRRHGARNRIRRRSGTCNRLVSATSNNVLRVVNAYDHQSRRIRKEVYTRADPTCNYEPVTCNSFLYDGWNVIRETIQNPQSAITNYYTWGLDLSGTLQGAGGVGGLLAVTTLSTCNNQPVTCNTYYPLYDANGNVTSYLDQSGAVVASREYDAFGNTVAMSGPQAGVFAYWFSTKYFDPETGLYYYGHRFYHPELGRWVNRDLLEERGGISLYAFIDNDTLSVWDYLGQRAQGEHINSKIRQHIIDYSQGEEVTLPYLQYFLGDPVGGRVCGFDLRSWRPLATCYKVENNDSRIQINIVAHPYIVLSGKDPKNKPRTENGVKHSRKHEQQHIDKIMKLCSDAESAFRKLDKVYKDCTECNEALKSTKDEISEALNKARRIELNHDETEWSWWNKEGVIW